MERTGKELTLTHPDMPDPSVLTHIAERLKRALSAEKVIVYGSVARGEATIHSDIDLLEIAPTTEHAYVRMARAGRHPRPELRHTCIPLRADAGRGSAASDSRRPIHSRGS